MRTLKNSRVVVASLFVLCTAAPSVALLPNVNYFDFSGWDHNQITSPAGQTFNVAPGLNVTVTGVGAFSLPSEFSGGFIRSKHLNAGEMNEFRFSFGSSIPVVVKSTTVDKFEDVRIYGVGAESYFHDSGSAPTVSPDGSGIQLLGTGVGPTAARGETTTFAQANAFTVRIQHRSLAPNKFEQFMVGTVVPEPTSAGLLSVILAAAGLLRKRG